MLEEGDPAAARAGTRCLHPTLTGLGDRAHLARPEVGLANHVEDVANVLMYEDLSGVVLVGNSSGGMVITGVADRAPERIGRLVYLDAFVPEDGQCLLDLVPPGRAVSIEREVFLGPPLPQPTRRGSPPALLVVVHGFLARGAEHAH